MQHLRRSHKVRLTRALVEKLWSPKTREEHMAWGYRELAQFENREHVGLLQELVPLLSPAELSAWAQGCVENDPKLLYLLVKQRGMFYDSDTGLKLCNFRHKLATTLAFEGLLFMTVDAMRVEERDVSSIYSSSRVDKTDVMMGLVYSAVNDRGDDLERFGHCQRLLLDLMLKDAERIEMCYTNLLNPSQASQLVLKHTNHFLTMLLTRRDGPEPHVVLTMRRVGVITDDAVFALLGKGRNLVNNFINYCGIFETRRVLEHLTIYTSWMCSTKRVWTVPEMLQLVARIKARTDASTEAYVARMTEAVAGRTITMRSASSITHSLKCILRVLGAQILQGTTSGSEARQVLDVIPEAQKLARSAFAPMVVKKHVLIICVVLGLSEDDLAVCDPLPESFWSKFELSRSDADIALAEAPALGEDDRELFRAFSVAYAFGAEAAAAEPPITDVPDELD